MAPEEMERENIGEYVWDPANEVPAGEDMTPEQVGECGYNYTVKANDTIYLLSQKFMISWQNIAAANGLTSPYVIRPGQVLVIPILVYRVKRGDSLWSIGEMENIRWQDIAAANDIRYPYTIFPGQVLALPGKGCTLAPPEPPVPPPTPPVRIPCGLIVIVRSGDTVSSLATLFGVTNEVIIRANRLQPPYTIYVNQQLLIPVVPRYYRVQAGDTLSSIANRYGTTVEGIARVNGIRPPYTIFPGQVLLVVSPCRRMREEEMGYEGNEYYYDTEPY